MKIFVKAMDKRGQDFLYLKNKLLRISKAEIKEGIFIDSQITELMKGRDSEKGSNGVEKPHESLLKGCN